MPTSLLYKLRLFYIHVKSQNYTLKSISLLNLWFLNFEILCVSEKKMDVPEQIKLFKSQFVIPKNNNLSSIRNIIPLYFLKQSY